MLLQLSFKLWVWHWRPHFLNRLPYLFIVIYSSHVVLIVQSIVILKIVCFLSFFKMWCITVYTVGGVILILCKEIYCSSIFSFLNVTFPSTLQFLKIFGMGLDVLTVVKIHNVVCTIYSGTYLVLKVLEELWVCLHRPSDDGSSRSRPNHLCWSFRLQGPITEETTIYNLNIMHFSCIVSLCYKKTDVHVLGNT